MTVTENYYHYLRERETINIRPIMCLKKLHMIIIVEENII